MEPSCRRANFGEPQSEFQPQRELDLPLAVRGVLNSPCISAEAAARENRRVGRAKVCVIEDVKLLCTKLQVPSFVQRNPLEQRQVQIHQSRAPEGAS